MLKLKNQILSDYSFVKFVLVGIINTIIGNGLMFVLYNTGGVGYWRSTTLSYLLGSIVSYILNMRFTFKYKQATWKTIIKFVVNIGLCFFVAYGLARRVVTFFVTGSAVVTDNISMFMGMCIYMIINYIGQRFFVFSR